MCIRDRALEDSCDVLEAEARRRGMSVSDRLLMFLLKAHRPEVFGDKQKVDITSGGEKLVITWERNADNND